MKNQEALAAAKQQRKLEQAMATKANKQQRNKSRRRGATRSNKNRGASVGKKPKAGKKRTAAKAYRNQNQELCSRINVWMRECPNACRPLFRTWLSLVDLGEIDHYAAAQLMRCGGWREVMRLFHAGAGPAGQWLIRHAAPPEAKTAGPAPEVRTRDPETLGGHLDRLPR